MPRKWILEKIHDAGGWITMEKFMDLSLHDPEHGYYSTQITHLGLRGDFSTAATLSPVLAKALAARYKKHVHLSGTPLTVIETGAGDATLARDFRKEFNFWKRLRLNYFIVESSPALREKQKQALGKSVTHFPSLREALEACAGKAFLFSNELADAFPARVLQYGHSGWMEVGLAAQNGQLIEESRVLSDAELPDTSALESYALPGQKIEALESYKKWCETWSDAWKEGEMITIDYGSTIDDLYYRRPGGTLRGYYRHNRITDDALYTLPGKCDLTCDVNFTDLQQWGTKLGWQTTDLLYQRDFLLPYSGDNAVDRFLNHPHGAGTAFRVLIQSPSSTKS